MTVLDYLKARGETTGMYDGILLKTIHGLWWCMQLGEVSREPPRMVLDRRCSHFF
jgi:hypothetical protein